MTVRVRNAAATRQDILDAARRRFGAEGYERTTIRAVAADAGIDSALVIRYFGSKQLLFTAAADLDLRLPDLASAPPEHRAELLMERFFAVWEEDGTFLALLRAAMTSEPAAAALREVFAVQVAPVLTAVVPDHGQERAAMIGSLVIGLAMARYALEAPAITTIDRAELSAWTVPLLDDLLTGPAPLARPGFGRGQQSRK